MWTRGANSIMETTIYTDLEEQGPYMLKDSDLKIFSQVLNEDFDNDNNPWMKMKMFIYDTHPDGRYLTEEIPMIKCDVTEYIP